jgi:hypothetical protein
MIVRPKGQNLGPTMGDAGGETATSPDWSKLPLDSLLVVLAALEALDLVHSGDRVLVVARRLRHHPPPRHHHRGVPTLPLLHPRGRHRHGHHLQPR